MQSQQINDVYESYQEAREDVKDMNANSAKLTFYILEQNGSEMTKQDLEDEPCFPEELCERPSANWKTKT